MEAQKFNELLEKIKYNKKALDAIYDEYYAPLKAHVKRKFGKLVDPADITQDVFVKLMTMDTPKFVEYPTTWLYTLARNHVVDSLRKRHITEVRLIEAECRVFDLDETILENDLKEAMRLHLDEESQHILYLNYWERYQLDEVATMINMSYGNVRAKASRAYKILKKILKKYL